ncbi:MAG: hypothetical protein ACKVRN_10830 [Pyrinomonadaceae bacterium]
MIFKRKTTRRIFLGSCLMLFIGAILFALSSDAKKTGKFEEEQSKRAEGLRFRRLSLQDEHGRIDPDGLRKARSHIEEMKRVQPARQLQQNDLIAEAGVFPDSWSWLGPGNVGGRVRAISIHPANANDILIGSVSGGIWRTFNGGGSWFPINDFMVNLGITTIARNPTNANNLYAGTGESFGTVNSSEFGDFVQGAGIFRSDDGGASWNQLASTNNPNFNAVNRVAISPNGAIILAATNQGLFRSTDGGANWTIPVFGTVLEVDFHPTDSNRALLGGAGSARFSTDGGQTWSTVAFSPAISNGGSVATNGRVELAYWPIGGLIVYASVNNNNGRLYRSVNGGQNFTLVNSGTNYFLGAGNQGWYDNALWVNPQDPDFVIVGGIHLWQSGDGGTTLTQISDGSDSAHADHHAIVAHPGFNNSTNRTAFFANDGGIYRTDNVGTATINSGWTELNNNLGITQFYGGAGSTNGNIIGGTQDNGTLRYTTFGGTELWTSTAGADGGYCSADQTDTNYFYGATQNLGVFRSSNAGFSSTAISSGIGDVPPVQTNFIAPILLDPGEPERLLAGGWSLWRTSNSRAATPSWTAIKGTTGGNSPISAITISPLNSSFIVVGHNNGDVYYTFQGTTTPAPPPNAWIKIDNTLPNNNFITRAVIDTTRAPNWIYVTHGGFTSNNVYVTRDLGASWIDVTGAGATGLPDVPVRTLAIHPNNPDLLYAGTEVGIFTSNDAGATWDLPNGGPANVSVDELFWMGGDLIAATHGRGMYRASGGYYVDCNFNGVQIGTFNSPYKTVNAAINAIPANRHTPIWLKPCNYVEQVNTVNNPNKRFEIRALGDATITGP